MPVLDHVIEAAKAKSARVVFPEIAEPRVAAAVAQMRAAGLVEPLAAGDASARHVAALVETRGVKEALAVRMLSRPLYRAAAMVAAG